MWPLHSVVAKCVVQIAPIIKCLSPALRIRNGYVILVSTSTGLPLEVGPQNTYSTHRMSQTALCTEEAHAEVKAVRVTPVDEPFTLHLTYFEPLEVGTLITASIEGNKNAKADPQLQWSRFRISNKVSRNSLVRNQQLGIDHTDKGQVLKG